ncbi:efflux RND transporter permease subunit [Kistimonas asteriae]|uniref:efflux RND transporter permease subunit n=1 Tax=Kistimonas asteriae TaxID=517724 RepID=UPI001BA641F1|nr:MMPL family transporter [Kistimonas asteriae]
MDRWFAGFFMRYRFVLGVGSLGLCLLLSTGLTRLYFDSNFRIFFKSDNPQLQAHDAMEQDYVRSDNVVFTIQSLSKDVFTPQTLKTIGWLTEESWQIPYSQRVDSVTNYQLTRAGEDDLLVGFLVEDASALTYEDAARIRKLTLAQESLVNRLLAKDGQATNINIRLNLPEDQREAIDAVMVVAEAMKARAEVENPDIIVHLMGMAAINQAFNEMAMNDASTLMPVMFIIVLVLLTLLMRSLACTLATIVIIAVSVATTMGITGFMGLAINQVNALAPTVVMTLVVADCVHVLVVFLQGLRSGMAKHAALEESLEINFQAIFLTSLTTAIGFLAMNFSDSPPFRELGTITAIGVTCAFVFTLTLLPMIVLGLSRWLPIKVPENGAQDITAKVLAGFSRFVVRRHRPVFFATLAVSLLIISFIPHNELNDSIVHYFSKDTDIRQAADYLQENVAGMTVISYSLDSGASGGINEPTFLAKAEAFETWYRQQDAVVHVTSYLETIKRLNRNMHGDDPAWQRLPDTREEASQYQLLYELSLPFGLDLSNQLTFDKSAMRLDVIAKDLKAQEIIDLDQLAQQWFVDNAPELQATGTGLSLMFAHIGQRNIHSMINGNVVAVILISLTLMLALRSFRYGLLSMIPNAFPAAMAMGLWGMAVQEVNLAVAVVFCMTLGIVVDDTVHFLSKYLKGRKRGLSPAEAIHDVFHKVGSALAITSMTLTAGFLVLTLSDFNANMLTGLMVAITIVVALFFDFLFLPSLLLMLASGKAGQQPPSLTRKAEAPAVRTVEADTTT